MGVATAWDEMKGLSDYIKLAEILGDDYKIILVGLTKQQIEILPKNILGIERTNNIHELVKIYSIADLYVNLSYSESFGLTNLEAIACGTPVLTYDSGGSPESALNGLIIPRGNINLVAEKIKNFFATHEIKSEIFFDREEFDNKKFLNDYLKFYD